MSNTEMIHDLYEKCKSLSIDETHVLIKNAKSPEERDFVRLVTNYVLQQKQKEVIRQKRF